MDRKQALEFVDESNRLERIFREPLEKEILALHLFVSQPRISISSLEDFVSIYQPEAHLRNQYGLNARVGSYYPPFGGPRIEEALEDLLKEELSPLELHLRYELLHPFTDCNGRSGRALWAWKMKDFTGSFLENFYFQSLQRESHAQNP